MGPVTATSAPTGLTGGCKAEYMRFEYAQLGPCQNSWSNRPDYTEAMLKSLLDAGRCHADGYHAAHLAAHVKNGAIKWLSWGWSRGSMYFVIAAKMGAS